MTSIRFILRSLLHLWPINLAVLFGVIVGTMVLTGALIIGDSVRGSLEQVALDRLGTVEGVLVNQRFFREEFAEEVTQSEEFKQNFQTVLPGIFLQASLETSNPDGSANSRRAGHVQLIGCTEGIWETDRASKSQTPAKELHPADDQIVLNQAVADELDVQVGDELLLRIPQLSDINRELSLVKKDQTVQERTYTVHKIIPNTGLGRFGLFPSQHVPLNAFVSLTAIQSELFSRPKNPNRIKRMKWQRERINALFLTSTKKNYNSFSIDQSKAAIENLNQQLRPTLTDDQLGLFYSKKGFWQLDSSEMLVPEEVWNALQKHKKYSSIRVFTYLANTLASGEKEIPYSTISAVNFAPKAPLGPMLDPEGKVIPPLEEGEIALTDWAANDLNVKLGDQITVKYYEPETTHGEVKELSTQLKLTAIVKLEGIAEDQDWTPSFPGVSDRISIANWDPPFPYDNSRIRSEDEEYWSDYRTTPKAYVSYETGEKLWGSRFGAITSIRLAPGDLSTPMAEPTKQDQELLAQKIEDTIEPDKLGFNFLPIKADQLTASSGSTPFSVLFLGFSMFVIAAAVMLVALLFRLSVDYRASDIGLLKAVGWDDVKIRKTLSTEGLLIATAGSVGGVVLGVLYAKAMIAALTSPRFWLDAISTPFLSLHINPISYALGFTCGAFISWLAIRFSLSRLTHLGIVPLLTGTTEEDIRTKKKPAKARFAIICLVIGIALLPASVKTEGMEQAGVFFGAGSMMLISMLLFVRWKLQGESRSSLRLVGTAALRRLSIMNGTRRPMRSLLTIGLVASATFLIVAIGAFHLDMESLEIKKNTGNGGFVLVAETDNSILKDLNDFENEDFEQYFNFLEEDVALLKSDPRTNIYGFRVRPGDDASCLNLYQTSSPRVLGASSEFIERGGFKFTMTSDSSFENPWDQLNTKEEDGTIPVILDMATALYSLKVYPGKILEMEDDAANPLKLRVVGLLENSIFQGDVIMAETFFKERFPSRSGKGYFLIETEKSKADKIAALLEKSLGEYNFDTQKTNTKIAAFLAVQNTYLSTFQSIGSLGLLLGTLGLATVQMRNVLERKSELGLLRAIGFTNSRLAHLVWWENIFLLLGGVGLGVASALVTIIPHLLAGGADIPWFMLGGMLGTIVVVGMIVSSIAVRAAVKTSIISALNEP